MPASVCRLSRIKSQPPVPSSLTPLLPQHPLLALSPGDMLSVSLCAFKFPLTPSLHHLLLCVKYPRNTEVIQQYLSSRCTVAYCWQHLKDMAWLLLITPHICVSVGQRASSRGLLHHPPSTTQHLKYGSYCQGSGLLLVLGNWNLYCWNHTQRESLIKCKNLHLFYNLWYKPVTYPWPMSAVYLENEGKEDEAGLL